MSEIQFFQTHMGRKFFDGDFPGLIKELKRIADAMAAKPATKKDITPLTMYFRFLVDKTECDFCSVLHHNTHSADQLGVSDIELLLSMEIGDTYMIGNVDIERIS